MYQIAIEDFLYVLRGLYLRDWGIFFKCVIESGKGQLGELYIEQFFLLVLRVLVMQSLFVFIFRWIFIIVLRYRQVIDYYFFFLDYENKVLVVVKLFVKIRGGVILRNNGGVFFQSIFSVLIGFFQLSIYCLRVIRVVCICRI